MIVLLGSAADPQVNSIAKRLSAANAEFAVWDNEQFPANVQLSFCPEQRNFTLSLGNGTGRIAADEIKALYWRTLQTPGTVQQNSLARRDAESLTCSFLSELDCRAVNSFDAVRFHREKPRQLATVAAAGIRIPPTYVGNSPEAVREFCALHRDCIFKPVAGGDYATRIRPEHLSDEHLFAALRRAPITLQKFIPGTNVRTYVIGDECYSAEIRSSMDDFRLDQDVHLKPIELPGLIEQQAFEARDRLRLAWTAIDWRLDPQGHYFFLEANPSPMFVQFEQLTGFPLSQQLAQQLLH